MHHAIIDPLNAEDLEDWGAKPQALAGVPRESGLVMAGVEDGPREVGVWECTPGTWRISKTDDEFCHILKGHWRLTDAAGVVFDLHAGDSVLLAAGYTGVAEVIATVRKVYCITRREHSHDRKGT